MIGTCSGEGCNSIHIQNKKYNLCGECVYKKNHGGKSRQEVQIEKSLEKQKGLKYNGVTIKAPDGYKVVKGGSKTVRKKPIKQISTKQAEINRLYKITCTDMDYTTEPVCTGCLKYQGGDIKLSHSHIISKEDCKRIGREDLIYDRENLTYHCMSFGNNDPGCHRKHENPAQRKTLADYEKNMEYIRSISEELYQKYK